MVQILPSRSQLTEKYFTEATKPLESIADKIMDYQRRQRNDKLANLLLDETQNESLAEAQRLAPPGKESETYSNLMEGISKQQKSSMGPDLSKEIFKSNEPKLNEIAERSQSRDIQHARLNRLEELTKSGRLVNSRLGTFLHKNGQLNPSVLPFTGEDSQEFVKLVADMFSGAKSFFGSRVTNFDLESYMKRLPSLLNTPEGKMRVIHDLRTISEMEQLYDEGISDIIDRAGGSHVMPLSKANRIWKEIYGDQIKDLERQLIEGYKPNSQAQKNPNAFTNLPKAESYMGKTIVNDETGEVLVSNGKAWVPVDMETGL